MMRAAHAAKVPVRSTRRTRHLMSKRGENDGGATLVEFALVLPIFAAMLFGMIQFGLVFTGWDTLRSAVQTSARMAAVDDAGIYQNQAANPPPCAGLATIEGATGVTPANMTTADIYCEILSQVGTPLDSTVDDTNPPEVDLVVTQQTAPAALVSVCVQVQAVAFTSFFPTMTLSSSSEVYADSAGSLESYQPYGVGNCVTLTITGTQGTDAVGNPITPNEFGVALSGSSKQSGGTLSFDVFYTATATPPSDCSSGDQVGDSIAVNSDGNYLPDASYTPQTAGYYWWYVSYSGDANNSSANSGCGSQMAETAVS